MQTKSILALAVLSATLLPMAGAQAQDSNREMRAAAAMDVGEFRGRLDSLQDLLERMRENSRLAMAATSVVTQGTYQRTNRHLLHRALGVTDEITANWKRIDTPNMNVQTMGTRDMARFSEESSDTAFVRNAVWHIQSQLLSAKLNGRETGIVTDEMMDMLRAAITRAGSANFRVVRADTPYVARRFSEVEFSRVEEVAPSAAREERVAAQQGEFEWKEVTIEHENLPDRTRVAQADVDVIETETVMEERTERYGAADLPQTGGSPELLYMLGSGLMGVGGLLLRRRR
ncbi:MAG: LPXTG cell wall anchor domain-containing protein [Armatimonadetes bacterium]|nr:LPXTG cell wall anchor domain-containing protein [Armatimonadota bacterium]